MANGMRGPARDKKQLKVAPPKNIKDVPRYLRETVGGFISRLFYIFRMVWQTGHWILIAMLLVSIFSGIFPAIISVISKDILNELQAAISSEEPIVIWGSTVFYFLIIGCAGLNFIIELLINVVFAPALNKLTVVLNKHLS